MDAPAAMPRPKFLRWLPYWAVLQTDLRQTPRNWVWRTWVLVSVLAAAGYLLYRVGVYREAGIVQHASQLVSELLRWTVLGSVTLVVVFTVGSIAAERGTLADSVLSRGISRYQYFLAKWHARVVSVLATFAVLGVGVLVGSHFLFHEDLVLSGCLAALVTVAALLVAVVSCGVTVSALTGNTVLSISVAWLLLYGAGFLLSLLPNVYLTPDRLLTRLPQILRGLYDLEALTRLIGASLAASVAAALVGLVGFARSDV